MRPILSTGILPPAVSLKLPGRGPDVAEIAPAAPEIPEQITLPVATLYIANLRSNRGQAVYGQSGRKYPFKYSKTHDKLIREYASKEEFQREELDLRRNTRNPLHVCTLLGSLDPARSALEAVDALAKAVLKVPAHRRKAVLEQIVEAATRALKTLAYLNCGAPTTERTEARIRRQPDGATDGGAPSGERNTPIETPLPENSQPPDQTCPN